MKPFHVYMLRCADGSYYIGHTDDLDRRMLQHHDGDTGYTATRKPLELVWQGEFESREGALGFEQRIKGWSRAKKEALIAGDWEKVKELARSRGASTSSARTGASVETGASATSTQTGKSAASVQTGASAGGAQTGASAAAAETDTSAVRAETDTPSVRAELVEASSLAEQVLAGQRRAIAKAITLIESTRADHRAQADELLTKLLPASGQSFRLGISGVPGVGKSTFIEALGLYLIAKGHRVAVLAVDPSSSVSGGSILGDKTRMEQLSVNESAFIRPSPSSGTLGGVAEKTREAMLVCEAAGYDMVIVETVGVGQSETAVAGMTDMFVLLQLPNAGDDLQAIKKGVTELADLVVINKADLDRDAATRAQAQIASALRILSQQGRVRDVSARVIQLSALKGEGLDKFWHAVAQFRDARAQSAQLAARRRHQALAWMWERIDAGLKQDFRQQQAVRALLPQLADDVEAGRVPASTAARQLLDAWRKS